MTVANQIQSLPKEATVEDFLMNSDGLYFSIAHYGKYQEFEIPEDEAWDLIGQIYSIDGITDECVTEFTHDPYDPEGGEYKKITKADWLEMTCLDERKIAELALKEHGLKYRTKLETDVFEYGDLTVKRHADGSLTFKVHSRATEQEIPDFLMNRFLSFAKGQINE